jgi:tetratricopeptide (TPR) repeat protein
MDLAHWVPLGNARVRGRFLEELCNRGHLAAAKRERDLARQAVWYGEPYRGNVWNQVARASVLLKDYDAAAVAAERSLHYILRTTGVTFVEGAAYLTAPNGVKAFQARSKLAAGKADEAVALARECLAVLPGHVETVTALAPDLDKLGRTADADALFRSVWDVYVALAKDHPRSAWAHHGAASVAAGCRRELAAALAHAKRAVELDSEMRAYQETLAEVHFRRGERDPALAVMRKLAKADPRNHLYKRQLVRYEKGDVASPLPTEATD